MLAVSCRVMRPVSCNSAIIRCASPSGALPRANGMVKAVSLGIQGMGSAPSALTWSTVHCLSLRCREIRNVSGSGFKAHSSHASASLPRCFTNAVSDDCSA